MTTWVAGTSDSGDVATSTATVAGEPVRVVSPCSPRAPPSDTVHSAPTGRPSTRAVSPPSTVRESRAASPRSSVTPSTVHTTSTG
ncbi:Uncharacterised protein [Mycobacteroides abscessus]|nr:Uncharacterised protein [Mycobacteroides abscessus]